LDAKRWPQRQKVYARAVDAAAQSP